MANDTIEQLRAAQAYAAILEAWVENVRFIPCASRAHPAEYPQHEAHWHMRCPCGGVVALCNARREATRVHGGLQCNKTDCRCSAFHRFDDITWTRI